MDTFNESTKQLGEIVKKSDVEDRITQIPAKENTTISRSLLENTSTHMKGNRNFFKLLGEDGEVFRNKIPIKALGENRSKIKDLEYDIKPNIQKHFTNTNLTTKNMDDEDKLTVYDILKNTGFYSIKQTKGLKSVRMKDAFYNLPKERAKIRNPPIPAIENIEDSSDNLQGEGLKIIIPSNIINIYTRLKTLLGLKLSGHSDTLTEASKLIDKLYKRGATENKQQYRNALNKFSSH